MTSSRDRLLAAAFVVALLGRTGSALADDPAAPAPAARGPHVRVDLGFGVGRLHPVGWSDFGIAFSWAGSMGWHVSEALALHGSAWGTSQVADGWAAFTFDNDVSRLDVVAGGPGATVRDRGTGLFVTASAGGALLRVRSGYDWGHDVHRDAALAATLRAGGHWVVDEIGPAFGASLGASLVHPLTNDGRWYPQGVEVDVALTVATR